MGLTRITSDGITDATITTADLADQSVTLAKLPHGTSSNDGKFLRANNGADPTFETVNTDLVSDTSPQLGADLQSNGNDIDFADGDFAVFGTGSDYKIYHDGSNAVHRVTGDGDLKLLVEGKNFIVQGTGGHQILKGIDDGAVELYHNNSKKFETTSSGVSFANGADATTSKLLLALGNASNKEATIQGISSSTNEKGIEFKTYSFAAKTPLTLTHDGHLKVPDNSKLKIGTGDDLQIYHDGSHSRIVDSGTGNLILQTSKLNINNADSSKAFIHTSSSDGVELYHDNSLSLYTTSTGFRTSGQGEFDGGIRLTDTRSIDFGDSADLKIYHDGNDSYVKHAGAGNLRIETTGGADEDIFLDSNDDIFLQVADGSDAVKCIGGGAVELYHNGGKKFASHSNGLSIKNEAGGSSTSLYVFGSEGESAEIQMNADDGDDNADYFRLIHMASDNTWRLQNYAAGSWQNSFLAISNGATELYNQGTKHFETKTNGVKIDSGGDTILEMHTSNSTAHSRIQFSNNSGDNYGGLWYSAGNIMEFRTNNAERMRLNASGHLSVGTTNSSPGQGNGNTDVGAAVNSTGRFICNSSGSFSSFGRNDTGLVLSFTRNGGDQGGISVAVGSVSYGSGSDYRLKENVVSLTGAITRIKQLLPKRFNFIEDTTNTLRDGFLAHEVSSIVPEAITGTKDEVDSDNNPVYQQIDQAKLVPLLTAALQEEIVKRETLEARVAALEAS